MMTNLSLNEEEKAYAIQSFIDILKFKTISGSAPYDSSYNDCAEWILKKLKIDCQLDIAEIINESIINKPIIVGIWKGTQPDLPVIILNSHYDVVPVDEEHWNVPCFEGIIQNNKIYGRGTQDMKCVCIQYLIAIIKLKNSGYHPIRSIVLTFVPDEEIGGYEGMNILLQSSFFQLYCKNIAVALDEGLASEDDDYSIFYGERLPWWIKFTATGNTGHGSRFIEGTAVEQIVGIAQKALAFREEQRQLLHSTGDDDDDGGDDGSSSSNGSSGGNSNDSNSSSIDTSSKILNDNSDNSSSSSSSSNFAANTTTNNNNSHSRHNHSNCSHSIAAKRIRKSRKLMLGDVTTLNLTHIHAGVIAGGQDVINIVPSIAIAKCDIRVSPHMSPQYMIDTLNMWCQEVTNSTPGLPTAMTTSRSSSSAATTIATASSTSATSDTSMTTTSKNTSTATNNMNNNNDDDDDDDDVHKGVVSISQSQKRGGEGGGGVRWEFIGNDLKQHQITDISNDDNDDDHINNDNNNNDSPNNNNNNTASTTTTDNNTNSTSITTPTTNTSSTTTTPNTTATATATTNSSTSLPLSLPLISGPIKFENRQWLELIQNTLLQQHNIHTNPSIFPAATDSRFLRAMGVRAFGFSPIRKSEILLHEHNECLDVDIFLEGCQVYISLITVMTSSSSSPSCTMTTTISIVT